MGIPLTRGFIAKFHAVPGGRGGHGVLHGTPATGSIIGLHYYLRIIAAMTAPPLAAPAARAWSEASLHGRQLGNAALAALVLLLAGPGAYPAPLLTLIRATACTGGALS